MITAVVNSTVYLKPELLLDANGNAVTTKVNADWTKTARLLGSATTATPTITHNADGEYDISFTPSAVGNWSVKVSAVVDGETVPFDPQLVQVITAAQADPAQALSGVTATIEERVNIDGDRIEFVRGDSYLNADGLAKAWSISGVSVASATIYFNTFAGVNAFSKAMVVSGSTIYVDLTTANTSGLTKGTPVYRYEVIATLSGGGTSTLFRGDVWVTD